MALPAVAIGPIVEAFSAQMDNNFRIAENLLNRIGARRRYLRDRLPDYIDIADWREKDRSTNILLIGGGLFLVIIIAIVVLNRKT